jgi:hypothetical protein
MSHRGRTGVAVALTLWCALHAATMVWAAVVGGPPAHALRMFATGVLTIVLGLCAWQAWRWVARRHAAETPLGGLIPDNEQAPHTGLSGTETPPTRW